MPLPEENFVRSLRLKPNECVCEYGVLGGGRGSEFVRYMRQLVVKGDQLGHVRPYNFAKQVR